MLACGLLGIHCNANVEPRDMGVLDLAPGPDLAVPSDLATGDDLAMPDDLAATEDLTVLPDLVCTPTVLLTGGTDVVAAGWTVVGSGPSAVLSAPGADITQLATATVGSNGSHLLLSHAQLPTAGEPLALELVLKVVAVGNHDPLDAAVAVLGAFTAPFGLPAERAQMFYVDSDEVGWSDGAQSAAANAVDDTFHTYVLRVDAGGTANVYRDGTLLLTRTSFTLNGTVAIGDQTNEPGIDSTIQIKSVRRLCPE